MRAILANEFGGPEVLQVAVVPTPTPGVGDLLVQLEACGVCFHDLLTRAGLLKRGVTPPFIPGHEFAGQVVAVGPTVEGFQVGQRVCGLPSEPCWRCHYCLSGRDHLCASSNPLGHSRRGGAYAEFIVVKASSCLKVPDSISSADAAILGCAVGSVYRAYRLADVRMGQVVIVTGAGGGTGLHSVQLAKLTGAHVIGVTSSEAKVDPIRRAGADEIVLAPDGQFHSEVLRLTAGQGADVVVDHVGTPIWPSVLRSVRPGGDIVFVGQVTGQSIALNPGSLIHKNLRVIGTKGATLQDLHDVLHLVATFKLRPMVSRVLPLAEASDAHRLLENRQSVGRIVLVPSEMSA